MPHCSSEADLTQLHDLVHARMAELTAAVSALSNCSGSHTHALEHTHALGQAADYVPVRREVRVSRTRASHRPSKVPGQLLCRQVRTPTCCRLEDQECATTSAGAAVQPVLSSPPSILLTLAGNAIKGHPWAGHPECLGLMKGR